MIPALLIAAAAAKKVGNPETYTVPAGVPDPEIWYSPRDVTLNGSSEVTAIQNMGTGGASYDLTTWGGTNLHTITTPADWGSKSVFNVPFSTSGGRGYRIPGSTGFTAKTAMTIATWGDGTTATFDSFNGLIAGPVGGGDPNNELIGSSGTANLFTNKPSGFIKNGLKSQSITGVLPMDKEVVGSHLTAGAALGAFWADNFDFLRRWWGETGDIMIWSVELDASQVAAVDTMLNNYYA